MSIAMLLSILVFSTVSKADIPVGPGPSPYAARIWDGERAQSKDYPETFSISMSGRRDGETTDQVCTGVLVHPKLILTAAHCFGNNSIDAVGNSPSSARARAGIRASVERRKAHPDYVAAPGSTLRDSISSAKNDIAFITLRKEITDVPFPQIYLSDAIAAPELRDRTVTLVGYGMEKYTRNLFWTGTTGIKRFGTKKITQTAQGFLYMPGAKAGALPGDSGGPVFLEERNDRVLIGLLHSLIQREGRYEASTAHLFTRESLCWVKEESKIDFLPSLNCVAADGGSP